ncbi:MAG: hypothetical protein Q8O57_06995, partial [Kiritimatiellota bacterium]|nr:hypothetical protein [Kiritimatiellota bacterium]
MSHLSSFHSLLFGFIRRYVPGVVIDALVVAESLVSAMVVRSITAEIVIRRSILFRLVAIFIYCGANYAFRLYHRMWRYASVGELISI